MNNASSCSDLRDGLEKTKRKARELKEDLSIGRRINASLSFAKASLISGLAVDGIGWLNNSMHNDLAKSIFKKATNYVLLPLDDVIRVSTYFYKFSASRSAMKKLDKIKEEFSKKEPANVSYIESRKQKKRSETLANLQKNREALSHSICNMKNNRLAKYHKLEQLNQELKDLKSNAHSNGPEFYNFVKYFESNGFPLEYFKWENLNEYLEENLRLKNPELAKSFENFVKNVKNSPPDQLDKMWKDFKVKHLISKHKAYDFVLASFESDDFLKKYFMWRCLEKDANLATKINDIHTLYPNQSKSKWEDLTKDYPVFVNFKLNNFPYKYFRWKLFESKFSESAKKIKILVKKSSALKKELERLDKHLKDKQTELAQMNNYCLILDLKLSNKRKIRNNSIAFIYSLISLTADITILVLSSLSTLVVTPFIALFRKILMYNSKFFHFSGIVEKVLHKVKNEYLGHIKIKRANILLNKIDNMHQAEFLSYSKLGEDALKKSDIDLLEQCLQSMKPKKKEKLCSKLIKPSKPESQDQYESTSNDSEFPVPKLSESQSQDQCKPVSEHYESDDLPYKLELPDSSKLRLLDWGNSVINAFDEKQSQLELPDYVRDMLCKLESLGSGNSIINPFDEKLRSKDTVDDNSVSSEVNDSLQSEKLLESEKSHEVELPDSIRDVLSKIGKTCITTEEVNKLNQFLAGMDKYFDYSDVQHLNNLVKTLRNRILEYDKRGLAWSLSYSKLGTGPLKQTDIDLLKQYSESNDDKIQNVLSNIGNTFITREQVDTLDTFLEKIKTIDNLDNTHLRELIQDLRNRLSNYKEHIVPVIISRLGDKNLSYDEIDFLGKEFGTPDKVHDILKGISNRFLAMEEVDTLEVFLNRIKLERATRSLSDENSKTFDKIVPLLSMQIESYKEFFAKKDINWGEIIRNNDTFSAYWLLLKAKYKYGYLLNKNFFDRIKEVRFSSFKSEYSKKIYDHVFENLKSSERFKNKLFEVKNNEWGKVWKLFHPFGRNDLENRAHIDNSKFLLNLINGHKFTYLDNLLKRRKINFKNVKEIEKAFNDYQECSHLCAYLNALASGSSEMNRNNILCALNNLVNKTKDCSIDDALSVIQTQLK